MLRAYSINGQVPAPILRARQSALTVLPASWTWRAIAWATYAATKPELRVMKRFVPRDRDSIDVGANVGVHSYFLARWSRSVHAFEPNPRLVEYLRRAVSRNVAVSAIALSDSTGMARLSIPRLHGVEADPYASIEPRVASLRANEFGAAVDEVEVRTAPLDSLRMTEIGFIKIDVEGHELSVLRGARETLERDRPTLLIELDQRYLEQPLEQALHEISALGYDGFFILEHELRPIAELSVDRHQTQPLADPAAGPFVENFLFRPRGGGL
jgi:FkbM family methyltransferase